MDATAATDACVSVTRGLLYIGSVSLAAIVSVPSLLSNLALIAGLLCSRSLPRAVRVNLVSLSAALCLAAAAALLGGARQLTNNGHGATTPSERQLRVVQCILLNGYKTLTQRIVVLSACALALERWLTGRSVKAATGKPVSLKVTVGCVAVAWLLPVVLVPVGEDARKCTCTDTSDSQTADAIRFYITLVFFVAVQVYTGAASSYVNYKSHTELEGFSLRSTRHNLAARFQARENIRITGLLFPTVALQWAIWMVDALSAVVGKLLLDSPVTIAIGAVSIPQLTATLWPMYALAHPVLILAGDERLRKDMRAMLCGCKMFGGGLPQNVVDFRISPDANNDLINRFWEKAKANI